MATPVGTDCRAWLKAGERKDAGALFLPLLAFTLLLLNNRRRLVGTRFLSHCVINAVLLVALFFLAWPGTREIHGRLQ